MSEESNWVSTMNSLRRDIGFKLFDELGLADLEEVGENVNKFNKKTFPKEDLWYNHESDDHYLWYISGVCIVDFKLKTSRDVKPEEGHIIEISKKTTNYEIVLVMEILKATMQSNINRKLSTICGRCKVKLLRYDIYQNIY